MVTKTDLIGAAVLAIALIAPPAYAQLEEVVVTATKREQTLQEVPVAVTVTQAATIERAQIHDLNDLQSVVPSLHVLQEQTSTQTNFEIRGFGNGANNPGIEPSVGVFIDGVYRSRSAGAIGDLVDVERVEVLRGPQSTLFGQNASAGVISIISKLPEFKFGGDAEVGIGNFGFKQAKARITGPFGDSVAFSLAGSYEKRDGYFNDVATGRKVNDRNRWDVRAQMLWKATDTFTLRLIGDIGKINELCCGVSMLLPGPTLPLIRGIGGQVYTGPFFDRKAYYNYDPANSVDNRGVSLHADWDLDAVKLTSITALRQQKANFTYDADFTSAGLADDFNNQHVHTFTQEIRLASNKDGPLGWMIGGYYNDETVAWNNTVNFGRDFRNYATGLIVGAGGSPLTLPGLENALGLPIGTFFANGQGLTVFTNQKSKSSTIFGQLDWKFAERLKLTVGVAYSTDKKDVAIQQADTSVFSGLNLVNIGFAGAFAALTGGLAPTPANLASHPAQAHAADGLSITPCSAAHPPPACNQLLGLYPLQFLSPVVPFADSSNDSLVTYTGRLAWNASDNINFYVGASTGFKATSWNLSIDSKPLPPATMDRSPLGGFPNPYYGRYGSRNAGPEKSTVYELGMKSQWRTATLNVALFNQSIKGFQSNLFQGVGFYLANAGKQTTKGLEVETLWKPVPAVEFSLNAALMYPVYDSYPNALGPNGTADLSGQRPAGIHQMILDPAVTFFWGGDRVHGFFRVDGEFTDADQLVDNIPQSVAEQKVSTLNAAAGVSFSGWDVTLWARNLTDDQYLLLAFPSVAQSGSVSAYPNQPRTFGITLHRKF